MPRFNPWALVLAPLSFAQIAHADSVETTNSGTSLSAVTVAESVGPSCSPTSSTIFTTFTSTAAADSLEITYSVDNEPAISLPTVPSGVATGPGVWNMLGRSKAVEVAFDTTFASAGSSHVVEVCGTQSGSQGRDSKTACGSVTISNPVTTILTCPATLEFVDGFCSPTEPSDFYFGGICLATSSTFPRLLGANNAITGTGYLQSHLDRGNDITSDGDQVGLQCVYSDASGIVIGGVTGTVTAACGCTATSAAAFTCTN